MVEFISDSVSKCKRHDKGGQTNRNMNMYGEELGIYLNKFKTKFSHVSNHCPNIYLRTVLTLPTVFHRSSQIYNLNVSTMSLLRRRRREDH